jgi:phosphatidate cytidylyltransferase
MTPPMDDMDPPTFQFGRRRRREREADPEPFEAEEAEAPPAESPPRPGEGERGFDEPVPGVEGVDEPGPELRVERLEPGQAPSGEKPPFWRRLPFARSETSMRVLVAVPWVLFAVFIVVVGGEVFMAAMIGLGVLGLREFFRMTDKARPIMLPAYLTVAAMVIAAHYGSSFQILLVLAASFPALFAFAAARDSLDRVTVSVAVTFLGILWFGLGLSHAMLLRDLPDHGAALLVDVLVATFVGDTAAYGAGRLFGSRRITPRISPNKTLEGLIGGFVGGTLGFWFAGLYQDWLPGVDALLMGMCIAALAPVGDLFASMIKRDLQIKDTGTLFGPHGGLIDRLDAVLFTVVAGYYLSVAFVY